MFKNIILILLRDAFDRFKSYFMSNLLLQSILAISIMYSKHDNSYMYFITYMLLQISLNHLL